MTVSRLQKLYQEFDREAAHAYVLADHADELRCLNARKAVGDILLARDVSAWKKAFSARRRRTISILKRK